MTDLSISAELRTELRASGLTDEQINRLQYRSVTAEQARELTGHGHAGWVVPCLGPDGKPYATSDGKPFQRLKASHPPIKDGKPARYLSPAKEGCRPYFSLLHRWPAAGSRLELDLTEGEKKADAACAHGVPTIGLSGVDGWRDRRSGDSAPLPELKGWLQGLVRIAWDSDIVHKPAVLASNQALADHIVQGGGTPLMVLIPPELDGSKNGVDDFIARHGAAAYQVLRKYARPAGEISQYKDGKRSLKWTWRPEPTGCDATHIKAQIAWTVLKDEIQLLEAGAHLWVGTHWQRQGEKPSRLVSGRLHRLMDHLDWRNRAGLAFGSVATELESRLRDSTPDLWDAPHLLGFSNGVLDTRTNAFTPGHRRSDRLTRCMPYPYDLEASCLTWLAFLDDVTESDHQLIQGLRAAMRWTLEPKPDAQHRLELVFDLHGDPGRGKGTILTVLQELCGGLSGTGRFSSAVLDDPNKLAMLMGKRVSIDWDAGGYIRSSEKFNSLISNEPLEVKLLYKDAFSARLGTVLWRAMNDRVGQAAAGADGAGRRVIPFPFDVEPGRRDPGLKRKLAGEVAGIFQWAWGLSMDEAEEVLRAISSSDRIRKGQIETALKNNHVLAFLMEQYPQGCSEIASQELWRAFDEWAKARGVKLDSGMNAISFGIKLKRYVDAGLRRKPLQDASGASFERWKGASANFYRIPAMDSWPVAEFITGTSASPDGPMDSCAGPTLHSAPDGPQPALPEVGPAGPQHSQKRPNPPESGQPPTTIQPLNPCSHLLPGGFGGFGGLEDKSSKREGSQEEPSPTEGAGRANNPPNHPQFPGPSGGQGAGPEGRNGGSSACEGALEPPAEPGQESGQASEQSDQPTPEQASPAEPGQGPGAEQGNAAGAAPEGAAGPPQDEPAPETVPSVPSMTSTTPDGFTDQEWASINGFDEAQGGLPKREAGAFLLSKRGRAGLELRDQLDHQASSDWRVLALARRGEHPKESVLSLLTWLRDQLGDAPDLEQPTATSLAGWLEDQGETVQPLVDTEPTPGPAPADRYRPRHIPEAGAPAPEDALARHRALLERRPVTGSSYPLEAELDRALDHGESDQALALALDRRVQQLIEQGRLSPPVKPSKTESTAPAAASKPGIPSTDPSPEPEPEPAPARPLLRVSDWVRAALVAQGLKALPSARAAVQQWIEAQPDAPATSAASISFALDAIRAEDEDPGQGSLL